MANLSLWIFKNTELSSPSAVLLMVSRGRQQRESISMTKRGTWISTLFIRGLLNFIFVKFICSESGFFFAEQHHGVMTTSVLELEDDTLTLLSGKSQRCSFLLLFIYLLNWMRIGSQPLGGIYCLMSEQIALVDFHIYVWVHLEGMVKMTFSTFQPLLTWLTYKEEFSWSSNQPILSHNRDLLLMLSCLRSGFWQNKRVYWKTFDGCRWRWYEETPHYDCSQFWFSLGKQM